MTRYPCPHCGGQSWIEKVQGELAQRCLCGLMRFLVHLNPSGTTSIRQIVPVPSVQLPRPGTKLSRTLLGVAEKHPLSVSTTAISGISGVTAKEASSLSILLLTRGLLVMVQNGQGVAGGSLWGLTEKAVKLLGIKESV